jgi:PKD repeat protein
MKLHHFSTILKGIFFSFIVLTIAVSCSKEEEEPPTAEFTFSPISPKVNEEVTFSNSSTNATSYQWSAAGTSFSSTAQNPKFAFITAGDFNVKLIATGPGGTSEIIKKVTVLAIPVAGFSFSPTSPKTGEEVSFSNTSTDATSYQWSVAGTSLTSTSQNPKFIFSTAGDFDVKLIATGPGGTSEITKKVTVTSVQPAPVAGFSFSPTSPKTGEEVTFTSTSTNATSYQWSAAGTSFSSTAQNPKFTFTTAGNYNVKLVVTNATGTNEITKQVTVTAALPAPVANFNFAPASPKTGEEVTFTSTSTNATSYQWSAAGTSFSSTAQNPKFTFTTAGNYTVKLVVTNATGTNEITKQVTVTAALSAPVANFNFAPASPKTGEEVTFTNTSTNATSYQWSAAGTSFSSTAQNPKFTFTTAGNYTVKLVVTNATGTNEITKQVTVTAESGGNSNPCNLPDCYVQKTTTVSTGVTTTITYGYTTVNGTKMIASIDTSTGFGNVVVSIQYDAQGRRIKDESRVGGTLQNSIEYSYSNGDKTVRANTYDAGGTLTSYTISTYDTSMRLTRTENYTAAGALTGYTVYSNFLNITGSFPQLVQTYNASNAITQTDVHTYQDCQLKSTVSKDGSGTVIGEVTNTIDAQKLLRTSVATIITFGFNITSTTQYVYDCD